MFKTIIIAASILIASISAGFSNAHGQNQAAVIDSIKMKFEFYKLKNGLQVVLQPDSTVNNVAVEFWLRAGSRNEEVDKYGLAHFFEHVTPYGLRNKTDELQRFAAYRTDSNAQVRKDFTRYFIEVKPEGLELALRYSAERINSESTDIFGEKVESERIRVLSEIERNSVNPFWSAEGGMVFQSAIFGKSHPYGHGNYGTVENNQNFKINDFREWFERYVHPENIILFVVGNFDQKKAGQFIKTYFGAIQRKKEISNQERVPPAAQPTVSHLTVQTNSKQHYLAFGWLIPEWGSSEDASFRVLAKILDERLKASARLQKAVIEANSTGLLDFYQYAGQFGVYATFSNLEDQAAVEEFLEREIEKLIKFGITESELQRAKQDEILTIQEMKKNLGFQSSRTELLGESLLFKRNPDFYFGRLKKQFKLKKAEIEKTTAIWLGKKPSKILFKARERL